MLAPSAWLRAGVLVAALRAGAAAAEPPSLAEFAAPAAQELAGIGELDAWIALLREPPAPAPGAAPPQTIEDVGYETVLAQLGGHVELLGRVRAGAVAPEGAPPRAALALLVRRTEAYLVVLGHLRAARPPAGSSPEAARMFELLRPDVVWRVVEAMREPLVEVPALAAGLDLADPEVLRAWALYRRVFGRDLETPLTYAQQAEAHRRAEEAYEARIQGMLAKVQAASDALGAAVAEAPPCVSPETRLYAQEIAAWIEGELPGEELERDILHDTAEMIRFVAENLREEWSCGGASPPPALDRLDALAREAELATMMICGYRGRETEPPPPLISPRRSAWSPAPVALPAPALASTSAEIAARTGEIESWLERWRASFEQAPPGTAPNAADLDAMGERLADLSAALSAFAGDLEPALADPAAEAEARLALARAQVAAARALVGARDRLAVPPDPRSTVYSQWATAKLRDRLTERAHDALDAADAWLDPLLAPGFPARPAAAPRQSAEAARIQRDVLAASREIVPRKAGEFGG